MCCLRFPMSVPTIPGKRSLHPAQQPPHCGACSSGTLSPLYSSHSQVLFPPSLRPIPLPSQLPAPVSPVQARPPARLLMARCPPACAPPASHCSMERASTPVSAGPLFTHCLPACLPACLPPCLPAFMHGCVQLVSTAMLLSNLPHHLGVGCSLAHLPSSRLFMAWMPCKLLELLPLTQRMPLIRHCCSSPTSRLQRAQ